jgi:Immunity protein 10
MSFRASDVGVDDDGQVLTAGVAEGQDGGALLLFMRMHDEPDEQDVRTGLDSYCVVTADQGTAYGAVTEISLRASVMRVVFAADKLQALGLPDPQVEVTLDVDTEVIEEFKEALKQILDYGRLEARPALTHL